MMQDKGQFEKFNAERELGVFLARLAKTDPSVMAQFLQAIEKSSGEPLDLAGGLQGSNSCANGESNAVLKLESNAVLDSDRKIPQNELLGRGDPDSAKHPPDFSQPESEASKPFWARGRGSMKARGLRQAGKSATAPDFLTTGREIREFKNRLLDQHNVSRNVPGLYMEGRPGARSKISPGLIRGGYAICAYVGVDRRTLEIWIRDFDFPAAHLPDGCYVTTPMLIDAWVAVAIERERERLEKMPELRLQYLKGMRRVSGFRQQIQPDLAKVTGE